MNDTIHYILVRRDLPFGVTLAQVAHAAAESGHGQHHTVSVLGVKDEKALRKWAKRLSERGIPHGCIHEPDEPWNGALMAIGVDPGLRLRLSWHFKRLDTYRIYEGPR